MFSNLEMIFTGCSKFSWDFRGQISCEHSKIHVLKKNRTLEQIIFLRKSLCYIKARDLFYQITELNF